MSQSRNAINRDLVSTINQILINLVSYKNMREYFNGSYANPNLSQSRIENIHSIQTDLCNILKSINLDLKINDAIKIANKIEDTLTLGLQNNNQLSIKYGYTHKTYEENRLSGHGIFSSWLNKTWFQSGASLALEKSIHEIQAFQKRYSQKNENTYKGIQVEGFSPK